MNHNAVYLTIFLTRCCAQQINGREAETATLLSRCPSNSSGLGGGFRPRHLNRFGSFGLLSNKPFKGLNLFLRKRIITVEFLDLG
jgi:hypothetical protein